jgi:hypothetical protein
VPEDLQMPIKEHWAQSRRINGEKVAAIGVKAS